MKIQFSNGELDTYLAFLDEARDHLDSMEEKILNLAETFDVDQVNVIFRGLHSIKGVASFLNLSEIQKLSHQLESVFDLVRQGSITIDEKMIHVCLAGLDHLVKMVKHLEEALGARNSIGGKQFEVEIIEVDFSTEYEQMHALMNGTPSGENQPTNSSDSKNNVDSIEMMNLDDLITDEMKLVFKRESDDLLETTEQMLMELEAQPSNLELLQKAFRNIHSYKGNCGFFGLAENEKLAHSLETLMEIVRNGEHSDIIVPTILFGLRCIDAFRTAHARLQAGESVSIDGLPERLNEAEHILARIAPQGTRAASIVSPANSPIENTVKAAAPSSSGSHSNSNASANKVETKRDLRVDLVKLDILLDLVGELVIASGMVINHPKLRQVDIPDLDKVFHQLQGVVADLQQIALGVRMVPVEGVFKKMSRLVHDLSAKCGKQVRLEFIGEKTEIDKNLGDLIADPLVHMIRNSIDHGMESPEERKQIGKDPTGIITLSADQEGGEMVIGIRDDGRGMNRERILSKVIEKGLADNSAKDLPDEEIFKFIFLPGFSTAEAITSTSGRGVGMDVVKSNVERMNGRIHIKSTFGSGTTIFIRIPLTLSIIEGMQVRVGKSLFILPMLAVQESIAPKVGQITRLMEEDEVLLMRGNTYPIVRLHQVHHLKGAIENIEKGILLRIDVQGASYCLLVDEIVGQRQTVVKALPSYFGQIPGVTACSILDDGAISLILDPPGIWTRHCDRNNSSEKELLNEN